LAKATSTCYSSRDAKKESRNGSKEAKRHVLLVSRGKVNNWWAQSAHLKHHDSPESHFGRYRIIVGHVSDEGKGVVVEQWMTLNDVAEELKISLRTVQHYSGTDPDFPPVYRFGRRNSRITRSEYEAWKGGKRMTD